MNITATLSTDLIDESQNITEWRNAVLWTVYVRANMPRECAGEPGYRQEIYVSDIREIAGHGELLDFPVLRRPVLATSWEHAKARFEDWQANGRDDYWLVSQPAQAEAVAE
jgi:hypothetical protein